MKFFIQKLSFINYLLTVYILLLMCIFGQQRLDFTFIWYILLSQLLRISMASQINNTILCRLLVFLLVSNMQQRCFAATGKQQQVPCLFVFGDSSSDAGNNNNLVTLAKSNYPPYGIDFPKGPTGRFTNGRTIVDFIGLHFALSLYIIIIWLITKVCYA